MTTCTQLSDRMPEVALGQAPWTADEERHLATCGDCRAEWAIVAAASRLGATLAPVDPDPTAARVTERIRHEQMRSQVRVRRFALLAGLAAAAVLAVAVWAGRAGRGSPTGGPIFPAPAPVATTPPRGSAGDSQVQPAPEPNLAQGPMPSAALELPMPELDSLPAEALDSMLQALDEPLAHVGSYDLPPDESGDRELEQVLAGLEG
jgi:hypothetical protein